MRLLGHPDRLCEDGAQPVQRPQIRPRDRWHQPWRQLVGQCPLFGHNGRGHRRRAAGLSRSGFLVVRPQHGRRFRTLAPLFGRLHVQGHCRRAARVYVLKHQFPESRQVQRHQSVPHVPLTLAKRGGTPHPPLWRRLLLAGWRLQGTRARSHRHRPLGTGSQLCGRHTHATRRHRPRTG